MIIGLAGAVFLLFRDYAISNDEEVQHRYGELILAYYASGFSDTRLFAFRNLYLYGGLFDIVAVVFGRALPVDPYVVRHVLCALIGVAGIGATCATARLIGGPRAGFFATMALAVCGPYFGGMFNHTKDIPFAAAVIGATYFLIRVARDLPQPRLRHVLGFGALLGAALGLRAMGLLLLVYVPVVVALYAPRPANGVSLRFMWRSGAAFLPALALAYLIMIVSWPWAAQDFLNPVRALFAFAHFHYPIRTMLAGESYSMAEVPRWYIPTYLAIKLPLALLIGASLGFVLALVDGKRTDLRVILRRRETLFVAFIAVFPVACQVIAHGPAFTGLRHFLFVVPPLAMLAGLGFDDLLQWLTARLRVLATAALAGVSIWFAWDGVTLVRLHPYEYLFYNPLVGGLQGAQRNYEGDYWVNIMNEAVDGLEAYIARTNRDPRKIFTVAVCGERLPFEKEAQPPLQYSADWDRADFFIAPTQMDCDRAMLGRTVFTIERMGVVIGVVKDMRGLPTEARWPPVEMARKPVAPQAKKNL
ncbi:MAG TPA: glycosyltransferase family 39 protein [Xanthobacteraceae bacterium]|nr:glycosyltransferase family 39 protein [Xanthobacteraceae bacterium]